MKKCKRFAQIKFENFRQQYKRLNINFKIYKKEEDLSQMTYVNNCDSKNKLNIDFKSE